MFDGVITTRHGKIRGTEAEDCWVYRGIPYAAPPIGDLRLRPPQQPDPWSDVFTAEDSGPIAPQPRSMLGSYLPGDPTTQDEDCLRLNVWTPDPTKSGLPVMVFIHGGAYLIGSGAQVMYDGQYLARRNVVVVTINYRLGVLGFLANPSLFDPSSGGFGNWGFLDQIAALRWVQDNASAFGGDPAKVTVFGESAGAMSIGDLLGAPLAKGLFKRAIIESGSPYATFKAPAIAVGEVFQKELGLSSLDREVLKDIPVADILAAQANVTGSVDSGIGLPFRTVIDGGVLKEHPADSIAKGSARGIDLLVGTNRDEFRFFSITVPELKDIDEPGVARIVGRYLRGAGLNSLDPQAAVDVYREARSGRGEDASPRALLDAILTDWIFRIPQLRLADACRAHHANIYTYLFSWESPFANGALGACHALELPFVFGTIANPVIGLFAGTTPEAHALSATMTTAWSTFAASGVPTIDNDAAWPRYESADRSTMRLAAKCAVVSAPNDAEREFWQPHLGGYGKGGAIEGAVPESVALLAPEVADPTGA